MEPPTPLHLQIPVSPNEAGSVDPNSAMKHKRAMDKLRDAVFYELASLNPKQRLTEDCKKRVEQRLLELFQDFHTPSHPTYAFMIQTAIIELNENGSSEESISHYIKSNFEGLPWAHSTLLNHHLQKLIKKREVVATSSGCYMLVPEDDPDEERGQKRKQEPENLEGQATGKKVFIVGKNHSQRESSNNKSQEPPWKKEATDQEDCSNKLQTELIEVCAQPGEKTEVSVPQHLFQKQQSEVFNGITKASWKAKVIYEHNKEQKLLIQDQIQAEEPQSEVPSEIAFSSHRSHGDCDSLTAPSSVASWSTWEVKKHEFLQEHENEGKVEGRFRKRDGVEDEEQQPDQSQNSPIELEMTLMELSSKMQRRQRKIRLQEPSEPKSVPISSTADPSPCSEDQQLFQPSCMKLTLCSSVAKFPPTKDQQLEPVGLSKRSRTKELARRYSQRLHSLSKPTKGVDFPGSSEYPVIELDREENISNPEEERPSEITQNTGPALSDPQRETASRSKMKLRPRKCGPFTPEAPVTSSPPKHKHEEQQEQNQGQENAPEQVTNLGIATQSTTPSEGVHYPPQHPQASGGGAPLVRKRGRPRKQKIDMASRSEGLLHSKYHPQKQPMYIGSSPELKFYVEIRKGEFLTSSEDRGKAPKPEAEDLISSSEYQQQTDQLDERSRSREEHAETRREELSSTSNYQQIQPRRRGRPRKLRHEPKPKPDLASEEKPQPQAKRRGRKPKPKPEPSVEEALGLDPLATSQEQEHHQPSGNLPCSPDHQQQLDC